MLSPIDGKTKSMYVIYGDELARRAGAPEYMSPTALCRVVHKDSSQSIFLEQIITSMGIKQHSKNQQERYSSFSNFIEGSLKNKVDRLLKLNYRVSLLT